MSARRMGLELPAELLTELVAELLEKFVKRRVGLNRDFLLPIIAFVMQRWFGRTGYFNPH
jgi:hypothetical protein